MNHYKKYRQSLNKALDSVNWNIVDQVKDVIRQEGHLVTAGNGGSAAICEHLCCDMSKGTYKKGFQPIHVESLTANSALLTAIANDFGYEKTFVSQLPAIRAPLGLFISASGNSKNIIGAAEYCKSNGTIVVGFTGFDGGHLRKLSDYSIHVRSNNYGIVEDCHQIIMHMISQKIKAERK